MKSRTRPTASEVAEQSAKNRLARYRHDFTPGELSGTALGLCNQGATPSVAKSTKARGVRPGKRSAGPRINEHAEQVSVIQWWASYCGTVGLDERALMAIPNGGARHPAVGAKLKAEGVRPGVPDLFLALPCRDFHGAWFELKAMGGTMQDSQAQMATLLRGQGYNVVSVWGAQECIRAIEAYVRRALP